MPGLLARVRAHDAPDPLLVHALRRGRREVHADRRARRVPALGKKLGVDQDVDLAALVGGQGLGELARRRPARHGRRLEARGAELLREVVGVVDAGRVDDPRRRPEPVAVQARGRLVERDVVEGCGQRALLEVAAHDRHRVDRRHGGHTQAAKRSDQPTARRVGERQVVDRGGEDVGDLLRDQLLGRRHPDVERLGEAADRVRGLLAEGGVRLVADHELVRAAGELVAVPREPRVRLDRDRVGPKRLPILLDRVGQAVAVPLGGEVAAELVDEQPAVGEDQDAEVSRGLDEPGGGDRLAGRGGVPEAVATRRAGVLAGEAGLVGLLVGELDLLLVLLFLLVQELRDAAVRAAVAVLLGAALGGGDQLGQHPGERVDLVAPESGAGGGGGALGGEDPLEPEHQPVAHLPAGRRAPQTGLDLLQRVVQRETARGTRGEGDTRLLTRMEERLAEPPLRAMRGLLQVRKRFGRPARSDSGFLHVCSRLEPRCPVVRNPSKKDSSLGRGSRASVAAPRRLAESEGGEQS